MSTLIKDTLYPQLNLNYDLVDGTLLTQLETTIESINATTPWANDHYWLYRGTEGADVLTGSNQGDIIVGAGGKDHIRGKGGSDVLQGGAGSDTVLGGGGDDFLIYSVSENLNGDRDFYDGGSGKNDSLFIIMSYGEYNAYGWETTAFQNMLDKTTKGKSLSYTFESFDLAVKNIENIEVIRSNTGPSAIDDELTIKEGGFVNNINFVANDTDSDNLDVLSVLSFSDVKTTGEVTINTNGTFNYATNNQFNTLAAGEFVLDRFEYTVKDLAGETSTAVVTMTIQGMNDAVQIRSESDVEGSVTEFVGSSDGDPLSDSGQLYFTDVDLTDSHVISAISPSAKALGELVAFITTDTTGTRETGVVSWYYQISPEAIEYLSKSEQKIETFTVSIDDEQGGVVDKTISITITGTNDRPVISASDVVSEVHELHSLPFGTLATTGGLNFSDVDLRDKHTVSVQASKSSLGTLTAVVSADTTKTGEGGVISWTYNVNAADIDYLAENESRKESFFVTLDDGAGGKTVEVVDVFIIGSNDSPTLFSGDINSSITELTLPYGSIEDNGIIFFNDVDVSDKHAVSISAENNAVGVLSASVLESNGNGTVSLNYSVSAADVEYLASGETKTETFVLTLTDSSGGTDERTVTYTINGTNDKPVARLDSVSTWEDEAVTIDVLANDTDVDGDNLQVIIIGNSNAENGTVTNNGGQLTYTPNSNFYGSDRFVYTITDGKGGFDTETVYVNVAGVADAAELSLNIRAGETANKVIVDINSLLADDSETLILYFEDLVTGESLLPEGVSLEGVTNGQIFNANSHEEVVLILDEGVDHNFDFTVIAATVVPRTGDMTTVTDSINIELDSYHYDDTVVFGAIDQSIWNTGDEYILEDHRFIGIDEADAGNEGGFLRANWDYDIKVGLQSNLDIEGGNLDAALVWDIDFENNFNLSTDVLTINTSANNTFGSFSTSGPEFAYALDFIWEVDMAAGVDLYWDWYGPGALDVDLLNLSYSDEPYSESLFAFDSKLDEVYTEDFGYGVTGSLAWPSLDTTSVQGIGDTYTSEGMSNDVLNIHADLDEMMAQLLFQDTVNPFDFSVDLGLAGGDLVVLDTYVEAGLNFIQQFELNAGELVGTLTFEDNSEQNFIFGEALTISSASDLDVDGDGQVEYEVDLNLIDSTLYNKTDLDFNVGWDLNMLSGNWWYDVGFADDSDPFGPLIDLPKEEELSLFDITIFEDTFLVNFEQTSVDFFA